MAKKPATLPPPTNPLVNALLTDLYQLTMTYGYFKNNRHDLPSTFELFFRKNPFGGEYTVFGGLGECLKYIDNFRITSEDIEYLRNDVSSLQHIKKDDTFWEWLSELDTSEVTVWSLREGTVCFPRIPLLMVRGPLAVCQLLETTLLTLINYPSLIATNAARMVLAAAQGTQRLSSNNLLDATDQEESLPPQCFVSQKCVEFGLRRAQGPDGGVSASRYAIMGGFVGTSNVQAGKLWKLPLSGTHAHAWVQSFTDLESLECTSIPHPKTGEKVDILPLVMEYRETMSKQFPHYATTNLGELAAFIAYAVAFPQTFLCLIDTYDTLYSGLPNFCLVAMVLDDMGYKPRGVRLDSGDLAYLSLSVARHWVQLNREFTKQLDVVASNDINESVLHTLSQQNHAITVYGIGTNLVTCQRQPALGCVYKLVEISGRPRMKLSQDVSKVLIPGRKRAFRLGGKDGHPLMDLMVREHEDDPKAQEKILCRHAFIERKRAAVTPTTVTPLHVCVYRQGTVMQEHIRTLDEARVATRDELASLRPDVRRHLNPTPYKVAVTQELFTFLHDMWQNETPVPELE